MVDANTDWQIKKFADKLKDIVCIVTGYSRDQLEDRDLKEKPLGKDWVVYKAYNIKYSTTKLLLNLKDALEYADGFGSCVRKVELTPRLLMQLIGTDCMRNIIHPNIWVISLFSNYNEDSNWIITDPRFTNQIEAIKERGGFVIRIERSIDLRFPNHWKEFSQECSTLNEFEFISWLKNHKLQEYNDLGEAITHYSETALDDYQDFDYVINNNGSVENLIEKIKQILENENII